MAKTGWIYEGNTFLSATRGSHRKALTLFEDSHAKLKSESANDAYIAAICADFEPFYFAFRDLYAQKQSAQGIYEGHTFSFEATLSEMPLMLRKWESQIRVHFIEDSPQERMIFPNKRSPFLAGTYEQRISAVNSLLLSVQKFPQLASVVPSIESYYNKLEGARLAQQGEEGQNDKLSTLLEKQRIITCEEMHGVLGRLMFHYRYERDRIADYFDLSLIRSKQGTGEVTTFKGTVKDSDNQPIGGALVSLPEISIETTTDNNGTFSVETETGTFDVRASAIGYIMTETKNVLFEKDKDTVLDIVLGSG